MIFRHKLAWEICQVHRQTKWTEVMKFEKSIKYTYADVNS